MDGDLERRIKRAKDLLGTVRHAAMATVNEDGSPHNTPFRFLYSPDLQYVYWGSHPASVHSENVLRTGQIFVVLYDAVVRGGLYIQAESGEICSGKALEEAHAAHNAARLREGQEALPASYYDSPSPQRMWRAKTVHFWVTETERDSHGNMIKDSRREITSQDLL